MYKIKLLITTLLLLAVFNFNATAQNAGDNDPTFNTSDLGLGYGANNFVRAVGIQTDGKIIIGGRFTSYNGVSRNRIARLNVDGIIDTTFNIGTGPNSQINTIAIQPDGKIIIGGIFTSFNGVSRNRIARLNIDGSLDPTFYVGSGANGEVCTAAIQSDGKIIIGGVFTSYNGVTRNRIARLNTNGVRDDTFSIGIGADNWVETIAIQSDGKIMIGGVFTSYNGISRNQIARLNIDGSLDVTFSIGMGADYWVETIAIQSDGKIMIGGKFTSYNGISRNGIARLNGDGNLDTTFNIGTGANNYVNTVAIQPDGKIIIGGYFLSYNGVSRNRIARLNDDGSLDVTFNPGTGANNKVNTVAIQADGKITFGGDYSTYNGTAINRIARLNGDGNLDTTFNIGKGANDRVETIAIQADGKIIIGGIFTFFNGTAINRIARLNVDGSLDSTFDPGTGTGSGGYIITTAIQTDGKILIGGGFGNYNGTSRYCIARINTDGKIDSTFNPGSGIYNSTAPSSIAVTALQTDGKIIIGGYFLSYNNISRANLARLNDDGSLDVTFNPGTGANNYVRAVGIQPDGKIIIGGYQIARLNIDGSLDVTFNPGTGANGDVNTVAIQPDGKIIIGGKFTSYNGVSSNRIARLNDDGSLDVTFNPGTGANDYVNTVVIQADGKITIGGDFTSYNETAINRIAQLNVDGSLDVLFNSSIGANNVVRTIAIQTDKKSIIGGDFNLYNSIGRNRVARLLNDTVTGIENINNQSTFNIYPNPTTAEFIIELTSFSPKTQLKIVSVEGKTVYTNNTINTNKIVIHTTDWSKGIYMVKITDKQSSQVVKLVKQ